MYFLTYFICVYVLIFSSGENLEKHITSIPLRTSEASLSVLILHLLNTWLSLYTDKATFWILMRALRDHNMGIIAGQQISTIY